MLPATPLAAALRRLIAAGAAALVLTLTILAASPEAHEHVHHDCHHDEEHTCAVVLFAHGIWTTFDVVIVAGPRATWSETIFLSRPELRLAAPHSLLPPQCGPPVC